MKLSTLIKMAQNALKSNGDVDVVAVMSWEEECDKCENTESYTHSAKVYRAHVRDGITHNVSDIRPYFFVVAKN